MNIFKNSSLCALLFFGCAMLLPQFANATDEFDIVVVSGSQGGHTGNQPCSKRLKIIKSFTAPMPKFIIVRSDVTSNNYTSSQEIIVDDMEELFDFVITPMGDFSVMIEHAYVVFPNLLGGHQGKCKVTYTMEVHMEDSVIFPEPMSTRELVPFSCYLSGEVRTDLHSGSLIQNLDVFPTNCNTYQDILYELKQDAYVSIEIFDMQGKKHLSVNNEYQEKGHHFVYVNTSQLSNGTYFYKIQVNELIMTTKFVKLN